MDFTIEIAGPAHYRYAEEITDLIEEAAKARGTGIAKRKPEYVRTKMEEGKAIIALHGEELAGFCYIETWSHQKYVANSGLIVAPQFRSQGLAKRIKQKAFELSRKKYPGAKLFGITTSLAVMKINSELGYKPVTFSELTTDEVFWTGCQSCPNYDILSRTERKMCLCTGMLYDPEKEEKQQEAEEKPLGRDGDSAVRRQLRKKLAAYRHMQEQLEGYLAAVRRHEVEKALAYLADDFHLVLSEGDASMSKAQLRDRLQWNAVLHGRLTHDELEIDEGQVTGVFYEKNDLLGLLGVEVLPSHRTFRFNADGLIQQQIYEPFSEERSLSEVLQPAIEWAAAARPEELAELYPDEQLICTGKTAARWMDLLRAWRAEVPVAP